MNEQQLNPNTQPYPGPGDIDALVESKTVDITFLNQTFTDVFTVPEGYSRILAVIFDPDVGVLFSLKSQRARQDILANFNTLGKLPMLILGTRDLQDEVINYSMTFYSQGRVVSALLVTAPNPPLVTPTPGGPALVLPVFENQLPYKHTISLVYGR